MKNIVCICLAGFVFPALPLALGAEEQLPPERPAPPSDQRDKARKPLPDSGRKFRSGPGIWQVFSQMEPEERRKMQQLQREDPAKFRELMQAKAEELFRKRQARMAELREMAKKCREAAPEQREELRAKLLSEVEKDFRAHLASNRRHLAEMKLRAKHMEEELNRREANCSKAVEALVDKLIRDEKIHPMEQKRRRDGERLEK